LGLPATVGANLQTSGQRLARLSAAQHGGATVRIESSNPALALVTLNAAVLGSTFVEVTLANGQTDVPFQIQGLNGVQGNVVITASAVTTSGIRFVDAQSSANVVTTAVRIQSLATSMTSAAANDPFVVQIGLPNGAGTDLAAPQTVRAGGPAVVITVASSNAAAGLITAGGTPAASVIVQIGPGQQQQPGTLAFDPIAAGSTLVSLTATSPTGVITVDSGRVNVTVNP
jgi:hypothetical protein